jgi:hypothetical protein
MTNEKCLICEKNLKGESSFGCIDHTSTEELKISWRKAANKKDDYVFKPSDRVCIDHFERSRIKLMKGSIPTENLKKAEENADQSNDEENEDFGNPIGDDNDVEWEWGGN